FTDTESGVTAVTLPSTVTDFGLAVEPAVCAPIGMTMNAKIAEAIIGTSSRLIGVSPPDTPVPAPVTRTARPRPTDAGQALYARILPQGSWKGKVGENIFLCGGCP